MIREKRMGRIKQVSRRNFIQRGAFLASAALAGSVPLETLAAMKKKVAPQPVGVREVSPVEDLMREHGALNRILLIYDEALRRFHMKQKMDPTLLKRSARLIHDFIENYHEKLEEEFIFPKLKKAGRLVSTVDTLTVQHRAGRKLTQKIMSLSTLAHFKDPADLASLEAAVLMFIRMYRPHESREDTVVFPEFKKVVTRREYDRLGDKFEDREHELFGSEGFDGVVAKIAEIEKALGIYDLSEFTPSV